MKLAKDKVIGGILGGRSAVQILRLLKQAVLWPIMPATMITPQDSVERISIDDPSDVSKATTDSGDSERSAAVNREQERRRQETEEARDRLARYESEGRGTERQRERMREDLDRMERRDQRDDDLNERRRERGERDTGYRERQRRLQETQAARARLERFESQGLGTAAQRERMREDLDRMERRDANDGAIRERMGLDSGSRDRTEVESAPIQQPSTGIDDATRSRIDQSAQNFLNTITAENYHDLSSQVSSQVDSLKASRAQIEEARTNLDTSNSAAVEAFNQQVDTYQDNWVRLQGGIAALDTWDSSESNRESLWDHQVSTADRSGFAGQYEFIDPTRRDQDEATPTRSLRFDLQRANRVLEARVADLNTRISNYEALPPDQRDPQVGHQLNQEAAALAAEADFQKELADSLQTEGGLNTDVNPYTRHGEAIRRHNLANPDNPIAVQGLHGQDSTPDGDQRVIYSPEFAESFGKIVGERVSGDPELDQRRLDEALAAADERLENENPGTGRVFTTPKAQPSGYFGDVYDPGEAQEEGVARGQLRAFDEQTFARDPEGGRPSFIGPTTTEAGLQSSLEDSAASRAAELANLGSDPRASAATGPTISPVRFTQFNEGLDAERLETALQGIRGRADDQRQDLLEQTVVVAPGSDGVLQTFRANQPFDREALADAIHTASFNEDWRTHKRLIDFYQTATGEPYLGRGGDAATEAWEERGFLHRNSALALPTVVGGGVVGTVLLSADAVRGVVGAAGGAALATSVPTGTQPGRLPLVGEVPFFGTGDEGWFDYTRADVGRIPGAALEGYLLTSPTVKATQLAQAGGRYAAGRGLPFISRAGGVAANRFGSGAVGDLAVDTAYGASGLSETGVGLNQQDLWDIGFGQVAGRVTDVGIAGLQSASGPAGAIIRGDVYTPTVATQKPLRFPAELFATNTPYPQRKAAADAYIADWMSELRTFNPGHYQEIMARTGGRNPTTQDLRLEQALQSNVDVVEMLKARETLSRGALTHQGASYPIPNTDLQMEIRPSPFMRQRPEGYGIHATKSVAPHAESGIVKALPGKGPANLGVFYEPGFGVVDPLYGAYDPRYRQRGEDLQSGFVESDLSGAIVPPKVSLQPTSGYTDLNTVAALPRQGAILPAAAEAPPGKRHRATILVKDDQGRILMVKGKGDLLWGLPGGGVDKGETALTAGAREVLEETGYEASNVRAAFDYESPTSYHSVFDARVDNPNAVAELQAKEIEDVQWWDGGALDMMPSARDILEQATGTRQTALPDRRTNFSIPWGHTQDWRPKINATGEIELVYAVGSPHTALNEEGSVGLTGPEAKETGARYFTREGAPTVTRGQIARAIVEHAGQRLGLVPEPGLSMRNLRTGKTVNAEAVVDAELAKLEAQGAASQGPEDIRASSFPSPGRVARAEGHEVAQEGPEGVREESSETPAQRLAERAAAGDSRALELLRRRAEAGDVGAQAALRDLSSRVGRDVGTDGRRQELQPPDGAGAQRSEVFPPTTETQRVEIQPPTTETQRVEIQPPTTETQRVEIQPPTTETQRVEIQPPTIETQRVEIQPPTIETQRVEIQPPTTEPQRLEIPPTDPQRIDVPLPGRKPFRVEVPVPGRTDFGRTDVPPTTPEQPPEKPRRRTPELPPGTLTNFQEVDKERQGRYPRIIRTEEDRLDIQLADGTARRILINAQQPVVTHRDSTPPPAKTEPGHLVGNQYVEVQPPDSIQSFPSNPVTPPIDAAREFPQGQAETAVFTTDLDTGVTEMELHREPRRQGESQEAYLHRVATESRVQPTVAEATTPEQASFDEAMDRAEAAAASGDTQAQEEAERNAAEALASPGADPSRLDRFRQWASRAGEGAGRIREGAARAVEGTAGAFAGYSEHQRGLRLAAEDRARQQAEVQAAIKRELVRQKSADISETQRRAELGHAGNLAENLGGVASRIRGEAPAQRGAALAPQKYPSHFTPEMVAAVEKGVRKEGGQVVREADGRTPAQRILDAQRADRGESEGSSGQSAGSKILAAGRSLQSGVSGGGASTLAQTIASMVKNQQGATGAQHNAPNQSKRRATPRHLPKVNSTKNRKIVLL